MSSKYSAHLSSNPLFNVGPDVVWFNMALKGFNSTHKRRGDLSHLEIFQRLLGYLLFHVLSAAFSIGLYIHLFVLLSFIDFMYFHCY